MFSFQTFTSKKLCENNSCCYQTIKCQLLFDHKCFGVKLLGLCKYVKILSNYFGENCLKKYNMKDLFSMYV